MNMKPGNLYKHYLLIWFIALLIGFYFRLYPVLNFTTGESTDKATLYVINYLKTKIKKQINSNYPNLSATQKELLIKKQFDELVHKEQRNVRNSIDQVSKNIQGTASPSQKTPYLLESDPFYYYQLTENIIDHGAISDTFKGSKYLNRLMLAPEGHWEPLNLNPYIGFIIYKIIKVFNPDISLMYAVSFTPLVITALALFPFLFICYSLNCRPLISLVGSIYFLLSPIFIKRSTLGWFDNDPYNTFFPLSILAILFHFFKTKRSGKQNFLWSVILSFTVLTYAFFWQGWMFMFSIIMIAGFCSILNNHFSLKDIVETKRTDLFFGNILLISFLFLSIAFGPQDFFILFKEGWVALNNFLSPQLSSWPDLYITVGELHKISFQEMLKLIGGPVFFFIGLIGLIMTVVQLRRNQQNHNGLITLTIFWGISFILTLKAQRFGLLFLVPLSLTFTIGLNFIFLFFYEFIQKLFLKASLLFKLSTVILGFFTLSLIIIPISYLHHSIQEVLNPIFNETWERSLTEIKERTPENSVINTWWPPGHFIKAIAHRRVTFDGATINFPQAYWMANIFLTKNEKESLGILRMLNNSANQAADYLHNTVGLKLSIVVPILKEIVKMDPDNAKIYLKNILKDPEIDQLLKLTHATPPPTYLLIFNEFVDNNLQLKFIGNWNFKAIERINEDKELFKKVPPRNSKEYIQFLWELVGGPSQFSPKMTELSHQGSILTFENNIFCDTDQMDCYVKGANNKKAYPKSILYLDGQTVREKKFPKYTIPYSMLFLNESGKHNLIMLDDDLAQSMLIQLYFFDGKELAHFKPFIEESDLTGRTKIKVFEVNWNNFDDNQ